MKFGEILKVMKVGIKFLIRVELKVLIDMSEIIEMEEKDLLKEEY